MGISCKKWYAFTHDATTAWPMLAHVEPKFGNLADLGRGRMFHPTKGEDPNWWWPSFEGLKASEWRAMDGELVLLESHGIKGKDGSVEKTIIQVGFMSFPLRVEGQTRERGTTIRSEREMRLDASWCREFHPDLQDFYRPLSWSVLLGAVGVTMGITMGF